MWPHFALKRLRSIPRLPDASRTRMILGLTIVRLTLLERLASADLVDLSFIRTTAATRRFRKVPQAKTGHWQSREKEKKRDRAGKGKMFRAKPFGSHRDGGRQRAQEGICLGCNAASAATAGPRLTFTMNHLSGASA